MPKRQHSDQYINFGFIELKKKGESVPQCVMCMKTLSNASNKQTLFITPSLNQSSGKEESRS